MTILKASDAPSTGLSRVPLDDRFLSIDEPTGTSDAISATTKPAELPVAGSPISYRVPRNGTDSLGYTFREGLGHGFQFSPKTGTPHPNTKEKDVYLDMRKIDIQKLNEERGNGIIAGAAAQRVGFPLAGKLLVHYFGKTGQPLILSPNLTGWGQGDPNTVTPYDAASRDRFLLENSAVQYFRDNPRATAVTVTSKWDGKTAAPSNSPGRNVEDAYLALGDFYTRMAGEFVAKRDSTGKVVSIDARIQWLGYDYYDFSRDGRFQLNIPVLGAIRREHLWMMAQPQVGLAAGFHIWIPGPVERIRVDLKKHPN
jgi:hypothetical protein